MVQTCYCTKSNVLMEFEISDIAVKKKLMQVGDRKVINPQGTQIGKCWQILNHTEVYFLNEFQLDSMAFSISVHIKYTLFFILAGIFIKNTLSMTK